MRQLKGKVKENAKEKKERKKEFAENKEKAFTIGEFERLCFVKLFQSCFSFAIPWSTVCFDHSDGVCGH